MKNNPNSIQENPVGKGGGREGGERNILKDYYLLGELLRTGVEEEWTVWVMLAMAESGAVDMVSIPPTPTDVTRETVVDVAVYPLSPLTCRAQSPELISFEWSMIEIKSMEWIQPDSWSWNCWAFQLSSANQQHRWWSKCQPIRPERSVSVERFPAAYHRRMNFVVVTAVVAVAAAAAVADAVVAVVERAGTTSFAEAPER